MKWDGKMSGVADSSTSIDENWWIDKTQMMIVVHICYYWYYSKYY